MRKLFMLALVLVALAPVKLAMAADPMGGQVQQCEAFRHVLETSDWLILCRLHLIPASNTGYMDSFTISTTSGDFDDPAVLTNKVVVTTATDYTVTADATAITSFCTLGQDDLTIDCDGTGLADASHTVEITYRGGWNAYSPSDVIVRLDDSGTPVAERNAARVGYGLVGLYLTAADITSLALTWGDAGVTVNVLGSPNFWATSMDLTGAITWQATADLAETVTTLTSRMLLLLTLLEQVDAGISAGEYVQPQGVTNTGAVLANEAFASIGTAIPLAFLTAESNPFPDAVTTPTTSLVTSVEKAIKTTSVYTHMQAVHPLAGVFVTLFGSFALGGAGWMVTKQYIVSGMAWFVVMMGGWLLFAIPFPMVFIPAALLVAVGFVWIAKQVFD